MTFRAGAVVVVNFPGVTGIKRRPAVVLSSNSYHASRPDVVVGLITGQTAAALTATDYALKDWRSAGQRKASAFRSFFATLPRSPRPKVVGHLSARDWQAIQSCVREALELRDSLEPTSGH